MLFTLGVESEVDHHDGVLFHDADQQDDSYQRYDSEVVASNLQREDRAHACRRQCRENRDGVDIALIQHA